MIKDIINSNETILPNDKQMDALKEYFQLVLRQMEVLILKDSKNI